MNKANIASHLLEISVAIDDVVQHIEEMGFTQKIEQVNVIIERIDKSWSGSWFGYQANVYYSGLIEKPHGTYFSAEWGLQQTFGGYTIGNWIEYNPTDIINYILKESNFLEEQQTYEELKKSLQNNYEEARADIESYLSLLTDKDSYVNKQIEELTSLKIFTQSDFARMNKPSGEFLIRDMRAINTGVTVPPHLCVLYGLMSDKSPLFVLSKMSKIIRRIASHLSRLSSTTSEKGDHMPTKIFLGHGRSQVWLHLKNFLTDRLKLEPDEFNRVSAAGFATVGRLSQMLEEAKFAFIIMTAEDEGKDGKTNARLNVIHELGLFQGKLGFLKAIILLEEGCEEFSNIEGLGQIRFPPGDISAKFEEIRKVLERENIL